MWIDKNNESLYTYLVANKETIMKTLASHFGSKLLIKPAEGDTSTTIAHLAQFVKFDPRDAKLFHTSVPVIAYDALEEEYGKFEKDHGDADYYDGFYMKFKDGSTISVRT
jgi:hypothetical protein